VTFDNFFREAVDEVNALAPAAPALDPRVELTNEERYFALSIGMDPVDFARAVAKNDPSRVVWK